jgi:hypothetical protein
MQLDHMNAIVAGTTGAATLTLAHETVRQLVRRPPRMDLLGMSALSRILRALGMRPPRGERLRGYTMLADLVANAIWFAPVASGKRMTLARGAILGGLAGVGAVVLTPMLGLPKRHRGTDLRGQLLTVGLYTAGGIAAAAMASMLRRRDERREAKEVAA